MGREVNEEEGEDSGWKRIYRWGRTASLLRVAVKLLLWDISAQLASLRHPRSRHSTPQLVAFVMTARLPASDICPRARANQHA